MWCLCTSCLPLANEFRKSLKSFEKCDLNADSPVFLLKLSTNASCLILNREFLGFGSLVRSTICGACLDHCKLRFLNITLPFLNSISNLNTIFSIAPQ